MRSSVLLEMDPSQHRYFLEYPGQYPYSSLLTTSQPHCHYGHKIQLQSQSPQKTWLETPPDLLGRIGAKNQQHSNCAAISGRPPPAEWLPQRSPDDFALQIPCQKFDNSNRTVQSVLCIYLPSIRFVGKVDHFPATLISFTSMYESWIAHAHVQATVMKQLEQAMLVYISAKMRSNRLENQF